jgi:hypothetical protein
MSNNSFEWTRKTPGPCQATLWAAPLNSVDRWEISEDSKSPYSIFMQRPINSTIEYFKLIGWVLLLGYFFLGSIAIIFGRMIGYEITVWCCISLAIVITIVFLTIIIFNLLAIFIVSITRRLHRH